MAKISLCLIVGNVEEYIERCLESFSPIADEICVVRAIGNQVPDQTLDIARHKFGAVTGEYFNAPGHEDWPHVDNFAAARQMSFDLATGDYCFWCDSDDVLASGAERVRAHAERGEYAAFLFPYEIVGRGVTVPRERMMRKEAGRWMFPVHECFKFHIEGCPAAQDDGVVIQHVPKLTKTGSNTRNLRILEAIPPAEMTPGLRYHLFGELLAVDLQRAIALGVELARDPEIGQAERYDVLMTLMLHTEDLEQRNVLLHEAYKTDPTRREALGVLAGNAMDRRDRKAALAYALQMQATPEPAEHAWNSRRSFYGHTGSDIVQQAWRFNGYFDRAEELRIAEFKKVGGPRISLLHATRGRPLQASKARKLWLDLAECPERVEHLFAIDTDDAESRVLARMPTVFNTGKGCVGAWNAAACLSSSPVLVQMSDDWAPPMFWDRLILERIGDVNQPRVLAVSDGHRTDKLLCMAICTRAYALQDAFLFHPSFTGVYSDNWFTDCAYARGQVIEARDLEFTHNHPAFGTAEVDATYAQQNAPARYEEGLAVYRQLHEGGDWSSVPGFFDYFVFYGRVAAMVPEGGTIVEVGVWMGRSIIFMAQTLKRMGKRVRLVAVDIFTGEKNQPAHEPIVAAHGGSLRAVFEANLKRCGVADMVEIIEADSAATAERFANGEVDFCFIDAAHDYESVKRDVQAWRPKVAEQGILAGHDFDHDEVARAVKEELPSARRVGSCWVVGGVVL